MKKYNVLFLCTGNSARSIMAERLLAHWGKDKFNAFSAGSHPTGLVNPLAIKSLTNHGLSVEGLRSKSWEEFAVAGAPVMDFVFTVCDNAAGESCPIWLGQPMTAHWGVEDPAAVEGAEEKKLAAFNRIGMYLENRIKLFVALSFSKLDHLKIKEEIDAIGKTID